MTSMFEMTKAVVSKAQSLGADVAGMASIQALRTSPSHCIYPKIGMDLDKHWSEARAGEEVAWPDAALSAVVIGVVHPAHKPEMDWWDGKGTPGNRVLMGINKELSAWLETSLGIQTWKLPYLIEKGGIFLKDAAVMAGLGCVGKNNLVITPEYGPQIRFRALLMNQEAEPTGPVSFHPCQGCDQPCRRVCPIQAFAKRVYSQKELHQEALPATDGTYDRQTCNQKMGQDIEDAVQAMTGKDNEQQALRRSIDAFEQEAGAGQDRTSEYCVRYCRQCELSCPVGAKLR